MRRFSDLFLTEFSNKIYIEIDYNMAREKSILLRIIKKLLKKGKEVYLYEKERVFTDDDIINLYKLNKKIVFNTRYIDSSNQMASNQIFDIDISAYVIVIDKLKYFQKKCEQYCKNDLDKVIFTIVQISNYVKYGYIAKTNSCLENCFLLKTGVCIDFSIAFWKCLDRLNIESNIIKGIGDIKNKSIVDPLMNFDHAWNQVKINGNWYNLDLTWYMYAKEKKQDKLLDFVLVDDKSFYKNDLHKTRTEKRYCKFNENKDYIKNKINEFEKYSNIFEEYDRGRKR